MDSNPQSTDQKKISKYGYTQVHPEQSYFFDMRVNAINVSEIYNMKC